jgi:hypothetical protein
MGTERNEILNIACLCGKGRITVTFCSPDHPYAHDGQTSREDKIQCGDCEGKYVIVEREKNIFLCKRDDLELEQAGKRQREQDLKDLEKSAWEILATSGELDSIVAYLNTFKTATSAFRYLSDCYVFRDIDDFRRKFTKHSCTRDWVKKYFYPRALERLFVKIQKPSKTLEQFFNEQATLAQRVIPTAKPVGEHLLHLKR